MRRSGIKQEERPGWRAIELSRSYFPNRSKIGPFKALGSRAPHRKREAVHGSAHKTLDQYRQLVIEERASQRRLGNENFDMGEQRMRVNIAGDQA